MVIEGLTDLVWGGEGVEGRVTVWDGVTLDVNDFDEVRELVADIDAVKRIWWELEGLLEGLVESITVLEGETDKEMLFERELERESETETDKETDCEANEVGVWTREREIGVVCGSEGEGERDRDADNEIEKDAKAEAEWDGLAFVVDEWLAEIERVSEEVNVWLLVWVWDGEWEKLFLKTVDLEELGDADAVAVGEADLEGRTLWETERGAVLLGEMENGPVLEGVVVVRAVGVLHTTKETKFTFTVTSEMQWFVVPNVLVAVIWT